ncbi:hypothetical protein GALL_525000 [mine drainage metagenome]|uniref:Uncharacterized protein n=1 Tax=mine drainage metagenome TaxID=410659 RepID=A0A1J5P303_9ZZZZ
MPAHRNHPRQCLGHLRIGRDRRRGAHHDPRRQQDTAGLGVGHRRQPQHRHGVGQRQRPSRQDRAAGWHQPLHHTGHRCDQSGAANQCQPQCQRLPQHHGQWLHRAGTRAGAVAGAARLPQRRSRELRQLRQLRESDGQQPEQYHAGALSTVQRQPARGGLGVAPERVAANHHEHNAEFQRFSLWRHLPHACRASVVAQRGATGQRLDCDCRRGFAAPVHRVDHGLDSIQKSQRKRRFCRAERGIRRQ